MGFVEDLIHKLRISIGETIRKFSAYSLILFFIGALYGLNADKIASLVGVDKNIVLAAPVVLAILSYFITEIAVVLFIFLLILLLIVFI